MRPPGAQQTSLAALHWIAVGHGHELTALAVRAAYRLATEAARCANQVGQAEAVIKQVLAQDRPTAQWMRQSLGIEAVPPGRSRR